MPDPLNLTGEALWALGCFTVLVPPMPKAWIGSPRLMRANLFGTVRVLALLVLIALAISAEDRVRFSIGAGCVAWAICWLLSVEPGEVDSEP